MKHIREGLAVLMVMIRAFNYRLIWHYTWPFLVGIGLGIGLFFLFSCAAMPGAIEEPETPVKTEIKKPKIQQYNPGAESKSAEEQIAELSQEYNREPLMHVYSFPTMINGKLILTEIRVYYWEISDYHYVELVTCNGSVISKNTKEKLREKK